MGEGSGSHLKLRNVLTYLPLVTACMSQLTINMTMFFGHSDHASSVSYNGTQGLGGVFFRLSLILFLPLWALTLLVFHSEDWVNNDTASKNETDSLLWLHMRLKCWKITHKIIGATNVLAYAMVVSFPVNTFHNCHLFFAGLYFLSLYVHLFISVWEPPRHIRHFHYELKLLRLFVFFCSTMQAIGLLLGILNVTNWFFPVFEVAGAMCVSLYIALFSVEFHHVFHAISINLHKNTSQMSPSGQRQAGKTTIGNDARGSDSDRDRDSDSDSDSGSDSDSDSSSSVGPAADDGATTPPLKFIGGRPPAAPRSPPPNVNMVIQVSSDKTSYPELSF